MHSRKLIAVIILFLTLLGGGLRFFRLSNQSFWTDEISSITTARAPLSEITKVSAGLNNCPPTYFLALRPIIGSSNRNIESHARSLSALAGTLSIPLFIGVVYLWHQRWSAALAAGLLLAVNPLHIWYSQEVRAYGFMLLFGVLTLLAYEIAQSRQSISTSAQKISSPSTPMAGLSGLLEDASPWWLVYTAAGLMAVAIHKTGLVFPLCCLLWHSWKVLRRRARVRGLSLHSGVLIGSLLILVLVKASPPSKEYGRSSSILELAYTGMTFLGGYSFGPSPTEIQAHGAGGAASRHLFQVGILAAVLLLFGFILALRVRSLIRAKETGLMMLGVGIVGIGALVSAFPYNVRYALPGLFGFLALIAIASVRLPFEKTPSATPDPALSVPKKTGPFDPVIQGVLSRLLMVAVVAIALWGDEQWFFNPRYRKDDSRAVAQWLVTNQQQVQSWTVLPDYLAISIQWYLEPHPEVLSRFVPPKQSQTTSFPPVPDVLILGRRHHLIQPDQIIASYQSAAGKIETIGTFAGFELYVRTPGSAGVSPASRQRQPRELADETPALPGYASSDVMRR